MTLAIRPTFSESWYRIADLKVRLRPAAQISRQFYRGERWYVVRDPAGNQYHRLSDSAYHFVALLDGNRTVAEAWETVGGQYADAAPTQPEVIQLLSQLWAANLIEANVTPDAQVLLRRHKQLQKRQWQQRLMSALFPRMSIWDPDAFLKRWMPVMRPLLSKFGAILWLGVVLLGLFMVLPYGSDLMRYSRDTLAPGNWLWLWGMFVLTKFIHEMGHAFACRRFGGECHELGIMLLVLIPTPYVDASAAWAFRNKWQRIFVGAAGMIFELFFASFMAMIWVATKDSNSLVAQLAFNSMIVASVSTVLFNANPLLRYDGYYMLSDLLEIPNLQQKSTEYSLGLIKRHIFRVKLQKPLPPPAQRFWLFVYSILSSIYRIFVGIMIILLVAFKVPVLGVLMAIGGIITWLVMPVVKVVKYVLLDPELQRKRYRAAGFTLGVVATAVLLIGVIPFWVHYEAMAVVEAENRSVIKAITPGFVEQIGTTETGRPLEDGDYVEAGQVLLVAKNKELDAQIRKLELQAELSRRRINASRADGDMNQMAIDEAELRYIQSELRKARKDRDDLTIRAPHSGRLIAPRMKDLPGRFLQPGMEICTVATLDELVVRTLIDPNDAQLTLLGNDPNPEVRLAGDLGTELRAHSVRPPAASHNEVPPQLTHPHGGPIPVDPKDPKRALIPLMEVRCTLDNPDLKYVPEQRAYVRFKLDRKRPLIWQWSNRFWQMINRAKQG